MATFPYVYINVIDPSFNNATTSQWQYINNIFQSQAAIWKPGSRMFKRLQAQYDLDDYLTFVIFVALVYRQYIQSIVRSRRWEKFWIPLSAKYLKRKQRQGYPENIWLRTGTLINAISIGYDKAKKMITIGIDPKLKYKIPGIPTNRQPLVLLVAKWMEYGTQNGLPARPLFRRAKEFIGKNIRRWFNNWESLINTV